MSERAWLIEVFRLHHQEQLSQNRIAKQLGLPRSMINSCFQRAGKAGVRRPVNEPTLERPLYKQVAAYASEINRLKSLVAKLQRMQFGKSSERLREKTQRQVREAEERINAL